MLLLNGSILILGKGICFCDSPKGQRLTPELSDARNAAGGLLRSEQSA